MQVVVTASSSALGQALLRRIAGQGSLRGSDGSMLPVERVLAVDRAQPAGGLFLDGRIEYVCGEYESPRFLARMMGTGVDTVFHLSALDADLDQDGAPVLLETALERSVDATRALLEACGFQTALVRVVLAGSLDAWTGGMPTTTRDTCAALCELLLAESARRHLVDACCVRLPPLAADAGDLGLDEAAARLVAAHDARAAGLARTDP